MIDGNGGVVTSTVTLTIPVYPAPTVAAPEVSSTSLNLGSFVALSAEAIGGTGSYSYNWSGLPPGCSGGAATLHCSPSDVGSYSISVEVRDSSGYTVRSAPSNLTVKSTSLLPTWLSVGAFAVVLVITAVVIVLAAAIVVTSPAALAAEFALRTRPTGRPDDGGSENAEVLPTSGDIESP